MLSNYVVYESMSGGVRAIKYYRHGEYHSCGHTSIIFSHGRLEYYQYGSRHCWSGPSFKYRSQIHYYIRGVPFTKVDYSQHPKVLESIKKMSIEYGVWLPIETAPRTGEAVLVGNHIFKCMTVSKYNDGWGMIDTGEREVNPTIWYSVPTMPDTVGYARY